MSDDMHNQDGLTNDVDADLSRPERDGDTSAQARQGTREPAWADQRALAKATLTLPDPEPRPRRGPQPLTPWWDWRAWSRRAKVLSILGASLAALLIAAWLLLPTIAAYFIRQQLPELEQKLGRRIDFDEVELHGISGASLRGLTVYDKEGGGATVRVDRVNVQLDKSPALYRDFKIESLELEGAHLTLRRGADGNTNYADLQKQLDKLFKPRELEPKEKKKPSPLARYFKPLPRIALRELRIDLDDALAGDLALRSVTAKALSLSQAALGAPIAFEGRVGVTYLAGDGGPGTQEVELSGSYLNRREGAFSLRFVGGLDVPLVEALTGRAVRLGAVRLELPATVVAEDLRVAGRGGFGRPLLSADTVRLQLTTLPPQKWGGVYVKETEINGLRVDLIVAEDGTLDIADILDRLKGPEPTPAQLVARRSADLMERSARAAAGKKPKKPAGFDVRDIFVTQRLFVSDAELRLDDRRPELGGVTTLSEVNLEFGYRGIQKLVELDLALQINRGQDGRVTFAGSYDIPAQAVRARLKLDDLSLRPVHRQLESLFADLYARHVATAGRGANAGRDLLAGFVLHLLGNALKLDETELDADLDVDLPFKGEHLAVAGSVGVRGLHLIEPSVSTLPVDGVDVATTFAMRYDKTAERFELDEVELRFNGAEAEASFSLQPVSLAQDAIDGWHLEASDQARFELQLGLPQQPAQQVLDGLPYALRAELDGLQLTGDVLFSLGATGTVGALADAELTTNLETSDFAVVRWPEEVDLDGLNRGMVMRVRDPAALQEHFIHVPPSTHAAGPAAAGGYQPQLDDDDVRMRYAHWTVFDDLSPWLVQLITTTEDGSFFSHEGFSKQQILSALQKNVDKGGFSRGASTISMQLIKNVFLGRRKTMARKLQEVVLTWMMESVVDVPKRRILEVYFNVIELGPEVYGITDAARYYFGKRPEDLTLRETAFVIAIVPRPRTGEAHRLRGEVTPAFAKRIDWYIGEMVRRKCDPSKLEATRARYERAGRDMPYQVCCPPAPEIERLRQQPLEFYVPDVDGPSYRPDLYSSGGRRLSARSYAGCNVSNEALGDSSVFDENGGNGTGVPPPPVDPEHP